MAKIIRMFPPQYKHGLKVLTKRDLDAEQCNDPNCTSDHDILYLHAICHADTPSFVSYEKKTGHLRIQCAKCGKDVVIIQL